MDEQGFPYITPVNFVFFRGAVYFHSGLKGEKLDNISRNPKVGFQVDVPLSYLDYSFNKEQDPCRVHQFYQSVVIRGTARVVDDDDLKTAALTALLAKHEGHQDFNPITPELTGYKACLVVEIKPEAMTGKCDLAQNKDQDGDRRKIANHLVKRGRPEDLETVRVMGYELEHSKTKGWRIA